jgi:hypothetical protein
LSEPNVVTLHVRYRLIFRHLRRYLLGVVCLSVVLGVAGGVAAHFTHSNRVAPAGHASVASSLLILLGPLLMISYVFWVAQRIGYYARPGEIGTVGVVGRLTRLRQPAVRFHRFTMTNRQWVRFLGLGLAVNVPVIVAVNETGQRSLLLSPIFYPQADIDSFLAASGLPVEGDWSDRVGRFSMPKRWPGSKDTRRQGWIAATVMLPPVLLVTGGVVAAAILVH